MIDVDTAVNHAIGISPTAPGVPVSICDKTFMKPMEPGMYVIKTPIGKAADFSVKLGGHYRDDSNRFSCSNYVHVTPSRGVAALAVGDVGTPQVVVFKPTGASILPKSLLIKKIGEESWTRFNPATGVRDAKGSLIVHADGKLVKPSFPDHFPADVARLDKEYAMEYWKSFLPSSSTKA